MTERIDIEIEQSPLEFVIEQHSQINDCVIEIKSDFGGLSVVHHTDDFVGEGSTNHPLGLSDEIKEAITSVENKVDKTDIPNQFYGTDEDGNQTTYDISVLGDVEDVLVDGESVVEDRIARIDLTGKVDKVNEAGQLYGTDSNGDQTSYDISEFATEESLESHINDKDNPHSVTKEQVGLGNVDNTSDLDKPISTATQTALDDKASKTVVDSHIANTNNPHNVTKAQVGLGNVDNTSDANKPISTATQNALDYLQEQIDDVSARGRFLSIWNCVTGLAETNPPESPYTYNAGDYFIVGTVGTTNYKPNGSSYTTGVPSTTVETEEVKVNDTYYYDGTTWKLQANAQREYTFSGIAGSPYDNTNLGSALNSKADASVLSAHVNNTSNPHQVTKAQVGLGNVDNTADLDKPISTATQTALNEKLSLTNEASKVYGTDANGDQTLYNKDDFGKVDDVKIHGSSVVINKIANLDVVRQVSTLPVEPLQSGEIVQYVGTTNANYTNGYFYKCTGRTTTYSNIQFTPLGEYTIDVSISNSDLNIFLNETVRHTDFPITNGRFGYYQQTPNILWYLSGTSGHQFDGFSYSNTPEGYAEQGFTVTPPIDVRQGLDYTVDNVTVWTWEQVNVQPQKDLEWGNITGTLSEQTDLQEALDAKQDTLTAGTNITIDANNVISSTAQESFFRGNFNEWSDVPTDTSLYQEDIHGNRVPKDTDFIVIEDASQFIPVGDLMHRLVIECLVLDIRITDETGVSKEYNYTYCPNTFVAIDDYYSLKYNYGAPGSWYIKTNDGSPIVIKGTTYQSGEVFLFTTNEGGTIIDAGMPPSAGQYQGAWRFAYYGTWSTDGITGWTPQYKIENTLPIANETTFGIAKLYNTTGQNTDGSMTQKSITDILDSKLTTTDELSKIYGTDSNGNQTSYNKSEIEDKNFVFDMAIASSTWNIQHNLNKFPCCIVFDSTGTEIKGHIEYVDINNIIITFNSAFKGKAFLN